MDAWRLYQFVQQLPALRQALEEADEASEGGLLKERLIEPLSALEQDFKQYEKLVEQSLDLEGIDNHEYRINPRYNSELQVCVFVCVRLCLRLCLRLFVCGFGCVFLLGVGVCVCVCVRAFVLVRVRFWCAGMVTRMARMECHVSK